MAHREKIAEIDTKDKENIGAPSPVEGGAESNKQSHISRTISSEVDYLTD